MARAHRWGRSGPIGTDCARKSRIKSRKRALGAAANVRKLTGDPGIEAYKCDVHHCWHLGHPPGWWSQYIDLIAAEAMQAPPPKKPKRKRDHDADNDDEY